VSADGFGNGMFLRSRASASYDCPARLFNFSVWRKQEW